MANTLTGFIADAYVESVPQVGFFRRSNPWWTMQLSRLKKTVYRLRSDFQKVRAESTSLFLGLTAIVRYCSSIKESEYRSHNPDTERCVSQDFAARLQFMYT